MAMTKAEKERMAQLERNISLLKAMKWPDYSKPASMTKADIEANLVQGGKQYGSVQRVARGWFSNSYDQGRVSYGCSNGTNHSSSGDITTTQGMGRMYASELEAWRAIRHEMTERFASVLARVDGEIARVSEQLISEESDRG